MPLVSLFLFPFNFRASLRENVCLVKFSVLFCWYYITLRYFWGNVMFGLAVLFNNFLTKSFFFSGM